MSSVCALQTLPAVYDIDRIACRICEAPLRLPKCTPAHTARVALAELVVEVERVVCGLRPAIWPGGRPLSRPGPRVPPGRVAQQTAQRFAQRLGVAGGDQLGRARRCDLLESAHIAEHGWLPERQRRRPHP